MYAAAYQSMLIPLLYVSSALPSTTTTTIHRHAYQVHAQNSIRSVFPFHAQQIIRAAHPPRDWNDDDYTCIITRIYMYIILVSSDVMT
jgi:hypothetical protein